MDFAPRSAYQAQIKPAIFGQLGYTWKRFPESNFSLSTQVNYMQQYTRLGQALVTAKYKWLVMGAGFDTSWEVLGTAGIKTQVVKFTYGTSMRTDSLARIFGLSHELSLLFYLPH